MSKKTILFVLILSLLLCVNLSYGQNQNIKGIGVGISKTTGDFSDDFNMGFTINGEWFKQYSENLYIGGRFAYNRWSPDEDELEGNLPSGATFDISGGGSMIELLPSVRYVPSSNEGQQIQLYGQFGAGLYSFAWDAEVDWEYYGYSGTQKIDESASDFGINFGAGAIFVSGSRKFSIFPNYNIIFSDGETVNYFTFNLGILLGN